VKFFDFPDSPQDKHLPHFCVFTDPSAPYYGEVRGAVQELARRENSRALAFIEIPAGSAPFKFFNFHAETPPFAIIVNWTLGMANRPYDLYAYGGAEAGGSNASALLDAASMGSFVADYFGHRLPMWVRSEPVLQDFAEYRRSEGAFPAVGSQWAEVVMQDDVDVLLFFFAPWCGFSKQMQPRIDDVARHLGHVSTLRVVKIDGTVNDIKHSVMSTMDGWPFLVMFPAGRKDRAEAILAPEVAAEGPEEWRGHLVERLRAKATHPIPDAPPPPASQADAAEADPEAPGAHRDLQEI